MNANRPIIDYNLLSDGLHLYRLKDYCFGDIDGDQGENKQDAADERNQVELARCLKTDFIDVERREVTEDHHECEKHASISPPRFGSTDLNHNPYQHEAQGSPT